MSSLHRRGEESGEAPVRWGRVVGIAAAAVVLSCSFAFAQSATVEDAMNMKLVGHNDLEGRSTYQPFVKKQGDRYILYAGHHAGHAMNPLTGKDEQNGTSIVDVTDPAHPKYLAHIPPTVGKAGATMAYVCNGDELPKGEKGKSYLLRTDGHDGHEIWDVTDPSKPTLMTTITHGLADTHKNYWDCSTGIAWMVGDLTPEGWSTKRGIMIYDLSDPKHPVHIRDYSLFGNAPGQGGAYSNNNHDVIYYKGRVYACYGTGNHGVMQILDAHRLLTGNPLSSAPFAPTQENIQYPIIGQVYMQPNWGCHTAFPLIGMYVPELRPFNQNPRDYAIVTSEATSNGCQGPSQHGVWAVDITDPSHPQFVSSYFMSGSAKQCAIGGRWGPHATNWSMDPRWYKKVVFVSYFNGGLRALDVRDPRNLKEIGHYVPAANANTDVRCDTRTGKEECKKVIQTNNVEVDDRGYIYIVDRSNSGLDILEATGALKQLEDSPAPGPNVATN